jgi:hypothetical protein
VRSTSRHQHPQNQRGGAAHFESTSIPRSEHDRQEYGGVVSAAHDQTRFSASSFLDATTRDPVSAIGLPFAVTPNPTALATDPQSRFLYVGAQESTELAGFAIAADGSLTPLPGSPFQTGFSPIAALVIN